MFGKVWDKLEASGLPWGKIIGYPIAAGAGVYAAKLIWEYQARQKEDRHQVSFALELPANNKEMLDLRVNNEISTDHLQQLANQLTNPQFRGPPPATSDEYCQSLSTLAGTAIAEDYVLTRMIDALHTRSTFHQSEASNDESPRRPSVRDVLSLMAFLPTSAVRERLSYLFHLHSHGGSLPISTLPHILRVVGLSGQIPPSKLMRTIHPPTPLTLLQAGKMPWKLPDYEFIGWGGLAETGLRELQTPGKPEEKDQPEVPPVLPPDVTAVTEEQFFQFMVSVSVCIWGECEKQVPKPAL